MNVIQNDDTVTIEKEVHRGEIFYLNTTTTTDSEQRGGRPVIIVSNEKCNEHSRTVTVVCVTSKEKTQLPTHVIITNDDLPIHGTIMCETVQTVSKFRLGSYIGELDENTMKQIERGIAIQCDIEFEQAESLIKLQEELNACKKALELAKHENNDELEKALERAERRAEIFEELYKAEVMKSCQK